MKKCVIILLAAALMIQLCGCALNVNGDAPLEESSGDSQTNSGAAEKEEDEQQVGNDAAPDAETDPAPEKDNQQQTVETSGEEENGDQTQSGGETGGTNGTLVPVDEMTDEQIVQIYMDQRSVWDEHELLDGMTLTGYYKTGYAFFDIDLDGKKELAVQLGGGTMQNCTTEFYRLDESGSVVRFTDVDAVFSLAVENLVLAQRADGVRMYLMHYTLKPSAAEYWEYWAKLEPQPEKNEYKEYVRFAVATAYAEDGSETYTYYIGNTQTDEVSYTAAFDEYMADLTLSDPEYSMIAYSDWTAMDDSARTQALLDSLRR